MRRVLIGVAAVAIATGVARAAFTPSGRAAPSSGSASACAVGSAAGFIAGRSVCLQDGARGCIVRLDRVYHRYGFHCEGRVLRLDVGLMVPILRRRALHIPLLSPGSECPKTPSSGPLARIIPGAGDGAALGAGPAYPSLYYGPGEGGIEGALFDHPNAAGPADLGIGKVLWRVDPAYRGRVVLVRGRELTAPKEIRFQRGYPPPAELVVEARNGLSTASQEWFREPGCYAFQLDGPGFSRSIVFEVRRVG
jgi:hypothetical protein